MSERNFSVDVAEIKIREAITSANLIAVVTRSVHSNVVATCQLRSSGGNLVSEGAGKGKNCHLGALAESLEHYVTSRYGATCAKQMPLNHIKSQSVFNLDGIIANLPNSADLIGCIVMTDVLTGDSAEVPAILLCPDQTLAKHNNTHPSLRFLTRYSTNSGTAFGCSKEESILHAMNELVERDTFSHLLMSLCGQHPQPLLGLPPLNVIDKIVATNPDYRHFFRDMKILITKTSFGPYFSIAIPKRNNGRFPICPVGAGCSLDPNLAIERATTELQQILELYDQDEFNQDVAAHQLMNKSRTLRPLIKLDELRNIPFRWPTLPPAKSRSLAEQCAEITRNIAITGHSTLVRTLVEFPNGCTVSQIYIPGFERFNLIRAGIPVIPQRLLHASKPSI